MSLKTNLSTVALVGANLIPLIGVLFFDWNAILVLALFWIENLIIGGFNIIKLLGLSIYKKELKALFLCFFFIFHYGAFCSVHGVILWDILNLEELDSATYFSFEWVGIGQLFGEGATVLFAFIDKFQPQIWLGIAALSMSHFVSLIENFILRGEIFKAKANELMAKPYSQIFILHVGLIIGALAIEKLGSPMWLLLIIIAFKVSLDVIQHRRRHKKEIALSKT